MLDLEGARAKHARAEELLTLLDNEVLKVRLAPTSEGGSYVVKVVDIEGNRETLALTVAALPDYPTSRWGVLIGDMLHDLRSALDHCAYQLVLNGRDPSPTNLRESQFPICDTQASFDSTVPRRFAGVSGDLLTVVADHQPFVYRDINLSPMLHLRELSNRDKHRLLIPLLSASETIEPGAVEVVGAKLTSVEQAPHLPLELGRPILILHVEPEAGVAPVAFLREGLPLYISLGNPAGHASLWLNSMIGNVERLIDEMERRGRALP